MLKLSMAFLTRSAVSFSVNTGMVKMSELIVFSGLLLENIFDFPKIDSIMSDVPNQVLPLGTLLACSWTQAITRLLKAVARSEFGSNF